MNESANVTQLTPSWSSLWLNWRIALYGATEQDQEHGHAIIAWIAIYHPEYIVRQTADGMLRVLARRGNCSHLGQTS